MANVISSRRATPQFDEYQIILLGERVAFTCRCVLSTGSWTCNLLTTSSTP